MLKAKRKIFFTIEMEKIYFFSIFEVCDGPKTYQLVMQSFVFINFQQSILDFMRNLWGEAP